MATKHNMNVEEMTALVQDDHVTVEDVPALDFAEEQDKCSPLKGATVECYICSYRVMGDTNAVGGKLGAAPSGAGC